MTKNLLKSVMQKPVEKKKMLDTEELIKKIESGYTVNRIPKHTKKKTFAPSTLVYGHGECPRYWYLAFEGNIFTDSATPYSVANMTSGTLSHGRIQKAMMDSGVQEFIKMMKVKIQQNLKSHIQILQFSAMGMELLIGLEKK